MKAGYYDVERMKTSHFIQHENIYSFIHRKCANYTLCTLMLDKYYLNESVHSGHWYFELLALVSSLSNELASLLDTSLLQLCFFSFSNVSILLQYRSG